MNIIGFIVFTRKIQIQNIRKEACLEQNNDLTTERDYAGAL